MTRTKGARNSDYEARRAALAARLRARLARAGGKRPSFAEMAAAAGVSLATLRHYFGDRDGAVAAVLALHAPLGEPHLATLRQPAGMFAASIRAAAEHIAAGLAEPIVAELHAVGLAEGLDHVATGPAYLRALLEPMIQAVEARLDAHVASGQMQKADTRVAALGLMAPLMLAHLHQDWLGGSALRPLDGRAHRDAHVAAFVRAYQRPAKG